MARFGRGLSPFCFYGVLVWQALYLGAFYVLEPRFPDAAFFSSDSDAIIWVWTGGCIVFMLGGWLFEKWLKQRMSQKGFSRLELALCLIFLAALLVLHHLFAPEFLRIF